MEIKRNVLVISVISALTLPSLAMAATVGNSAEVLGTAGAWAFGAELDFITSRDLDFKSGTLTDTGVTTPWADPTASESVTDAELESQRLMLKATFGVSSTWDIFAKLGYADADIEDNYVTAGVPQKEEYDGDSDIAFGIGAKGCLSGCGGSGPQVMVDGQYLFYTVDADVTFDGVPLTSFGSYTSETDVTELQLAVYGVWTVGTIKPYAGAKYSTVELENTANIPSIMESWVITYEEADSFGVFAGADYEVNSNLSFNAELRVVDETAISLGANWKI